MRYLSKIVVSKKEAISKGFRDSYAWHKAFWKAFPGENGNCRQFLSRIDSKDSFYHILILSEKPPTLLDWGNWQTKKIADSFLEHEMYRFELRVNPTVKRIVRDDEGNRKKNGMRTSICHDNALKDWMYRKAEGSGFEIYNNNLDVSAPVKQSFIRNGKLGKHSKVDFRGVLKVVDRELFKKTFSKGIGSARAFSFGMLVLEPTK